jgi:adenosylmethionine-8-amino-7-oxononanoate aminotransferase
MTMLGPPFIVTRSEIDAIAARLERVIGALEKKLGL